MDYLEDTYGLRINVGYYYLTSVGVDTLRSRRMLFGFQEQLRGLGIEMRIIDKRNEKGGNVDPRLISEAYRLLLIEKKAPANLVLVSGDKDYEALLVDYERKGGCLFLSTGGWRRIHRSIVRWWNRVNRAFWADLRTITASCAFLLLKD